MYKFYDFLGLLTTTNFIIFVVCKKLTTSIRACPQIFFFFFFSTLLYGRFSTESLPCYKVHEFLGMSQKLTLFSVKTNWEYTIKYTIIHNSEGTNHNIFWLLEVSSATSWISGQKKTLRESLSTCRTGFEKIKWNPG